MKRLVLLLVVALLALPSLALATDWGFPNGDPASASQTFQAYGELTGSYAVGCANVTADICSVDVKTKSVECLAQSAPTYDFCGRLTDPACGLNIKVNEFGVSTTSGTLAQTTAIGSNAMTMLGTASVCGTPGGFAAGTAFNEYQTVQLRSDFVGSGPCVGVTGYANYNANQTFNAAPAAP